MRTAGSQQSLQRGHSVIQYTQGATAGSTLIYSIAKQSTMPTAPLQFKLRSKLATTQVYTVYTQVDTSSLVVYATLYMLSAVLYVLGTYVFVILVLYSMHLESPPETVKDTVNTVVSSKGHTNDNAHKSNTQSISRAHT